MVNHLFMGNFVQERTDGAKKPGQRFKITRNSKPKTESNL